MILKDGSIKTFEVSVEQFNQLRYSVAKVHNHFIAFSHLSCDVSVVNDHMASIFVGAARHSNCRAPSDYQACERVQAPRRGGVQSLIIRSTIMVCGVIFRCFFDLLCTIIVL